MLVKQLFDATYRIRISAGESVVSFMIWQTYVTKYAESIT